MKTVKEMARQFKVSEASIYHAYTLGKIQGERINGKIFVSEEDFRAYKKQVKRGRKKNTGVNASELFSSIKDRAKKKGVKVLEFLYMAEIERMRYYAIIAGALARQDEIDAVKRVFRDLEA